LYTHLFAVYGPPQQIITDNAQYFVADGITSFIKFLGTQHNLSPAYTPCINGLCEKTNDLVVGGLKKTLAQLTPLLLSRFEDWDLSVPAVLYALHTKISGSLQPTPFELLYGCSPPALTALNRLGDFIVHPPTAEMRRHQALDNLAKQQDYLASLLNNNRTWPTFMANDLVLVKRLRVPNFPNYSLQNSCEVEIPHRLSKPGHVRFKNPVLFSGFAVSNHSIPNHKSVTIVKGGGVNFNAMNKDNAAKWSKT
jgi:hypothetical protein